MKPNPIKYVVYCVSSSGLIRAKAPPTMKIAPIIEVIIPLAFIGISTLTFRSSILTKLSNRKPKPIPMNIAETKAKPPRLSISRNPTPMPINMNTGNNECFLPDSSSFIIFTFKNVLQKLLSFAILGYVIPNNLTYSSWHLIFFH